MADRLRGTSDISARGLVKKQGGKFIVDTITIGTFALVFSVAAIIHIGGDNSLSCAGTQHITGPRDICMATEHVETSRLAIAGIIYVSSISFSISHCLTSLIAIATILHGWNVWPMV